MDENDFSKFGQSICDTVTDAVNSAMESMDFSGLSEKISSTADHIMQETVGAFTGKNGHGNKNGNVYEKTDKEKLELRFTKKTPGKVSGILMCTFGGIGTAGFGLPGIYTACNRTDRKTAACDKLWLFRFPAVCHCLWHIVKKWLRSLRTYKSL